MAQTVQPLIYTPNVIRGELFDSQRYSKTTIANAHTLELDPTDVFIAGYPKTGTSWCQEMIWLICNNVDLETAARVRTGQRVPLLELASSPNEPSGWDKVLAQPHPRFIYTNLQNKFFEKTIDNSGARVVIVLRNPKDTMVSHYHFLKDLFPTHLPSFSDYLDAHWEKRMPHGDWADHVLGWWTNHTKDNFLFIKYEDIKANHAGAVRMMADFMNKPLTEEQIQQIVGFTSFKEMKRRPKEAPNANHKPDLFTRKGIVGDWKNYFSNEQAQKMNQYIATRLQGSGLCFKDVL